MDKTPPRNRLIAFYGVISVATLAMLVPAFNAYYDGMHQRAVSDRLRTYDDLDGVQRAQAEWERGLSGGRVSIEQAMEQLAEGGRTAAPPIRPVAGEMNVGPLEGWSERPLALPESVRARMPGTEATPTEGEPEVEGGQPLDAPTGETGEVEAAPSQQGGTGVGAGGAALPEPAGAAAPGTARGAAAEAPAEPEAAAPVRRRPAPADGEEGARPARRRAAPAAEAPAAEGNE